MKRSKGTPIRISHGQIVLPYFRVGDEELNLEGTLEAFNKAIKAQR
jgi:hypothetical protein